MRWMKVVFARKMSRQKESYDFRTAFLLEFTRELIKGTDSYLKLKVKDEVIKDNLKRDFILESSRSTEQKRDIKNLVVEKIKHDKLLVHKIKNIDERDSILKQNPFKDFARQLNSGKQTRRKIFEPKLPLTVRYLKPSSTRIQINLGKLNSLARDPLVKIIEVLGKNQKVLVSGIMGNKHTQVVLDGNEIHEIVKRFSQFSKIPFEKGFFKAAVGNFVISAIVSDQESGSRFVLKKIGAY